MEQFCHNFYPRSSGDLADIMSPLVLLQRLILRLGSADMGTLYGLDGPGFEPRWQR
jgi:hypothetical protein